MITSSPFSRNAQATLKIECFAPRETMMFSRLYSSHTSSTSLVNTPLLVRKSWSSSSAWRASSSRPIRSVS